MYKCSKYLNPCEYTFYILDANSLDLGVLEERQQLKRELRCLSFQWYLDNVYPDAPFPTDHRYFGQVRVNKVYTLQHFQNIKS